MVSFASLHPSSVGLVLCILYHVSTEANSCSPRNINVLECRNSNLTSFPHIPFGMKYVDLSQNQITEIPIINSPGLENVLFLNLSHNEISHIARHAFRNLTHLTSLDLSYNAIQGSSLIVKPFHIEPTNFKRLKQLSLRKNPLGVVERLSFTDAGYYWLQYLDLSQCSITKLEHLAINGLTKLKLLNLSHNLLDTIDTMSFAGTTELQVLDLSYNRLVVIQEMPMSTTIHTILLGHNLIRLLKDNVFQFTIGLKTLNLERNQLQVVNHLSLPWETVGNINLDYNPWSCDCHMKWILEYKDAFSRNLTLTCTYPSRLRGRNMMELYDEDMSCAMSLIHSIVVLAIVLVIITLVGALVLIVHHKRETIRNLCRCQNNEKGEYVAVYQNPNGEADAHVHIEDTKNLIKNEHNTEIYA